MGDGGSYAGYPSFLVCRLRQSNYDMVVGYMLYGGFVYVLRWFVMYLMVVWSMIYGG